MIGAQIAIEFEVRTLDRQRLSAEQLHAQGERLMDALLDLEKCNDDVTDSTTSSDATRSTVLVEMLIAATGEAAAIDKAYTVTRTAIHTIGGSTPWEKTTVPGADYRPRNVNLEYV